MKTKVSFISRMMTIAVAIVMTGTTVFADGGITDVYTTGTTNTPAGDFVVRSTNDLFYFQGEKYEVFKVYYDDPAMNMKIAVNPDEKCKSLIAFTDDYTLFYQCNRHGFGVRRVLFANPDAQKRFDPDKYQSQTVLSKKRRIEKKDAVKLIAGFLPGMQLS
ncbi:MAG: hypothetical protein K9J30_09235 [Bacteroidales bacterium]|nr:hypothetical protein [Bacteroidales bacterium]